MITSTPIAVRWCATRGAITVNYAGLSYRFYDGVWFEPRGPAFMVVAPPIDVVVPTLPTFATAVSSGGDTYLYANDTYYRARPDLGGYQVVNDPDESPGGSNSEGSAASSAPVTLAGAPLSLAAAAAAPAAPSTTGTSAAAASGTTLGTSQTVHPRNAQTPDELARDKYECYRFAVAQSGFDPVHPPAGASPPADKQSAYERAQTACFEARGYTLH
jgi:hypothetical protein